mmetsp:Transcript_9542/g.15801  ORF Transcript_9542/g.15801 Transcript_9542/m.15801 type:complete len:115 (+) Transcript_9542:310-654(+)
MLSSIGGVCDRVTSWLFGEHDLGFVGAGTRGLATPCSDGKITLLSSLKRRGGFLSRVLMLIMYLQSDLMSRIGQQTSRYYRYTHIISMSDINKAYVKICRNTSKLLEIVVATPF